MEIIGVPEWDLFMMAMIDGSGHHRISIDHINCVMDVPAHPYLLSVCVCLCCLLKAHFCSQLYGDCPFASLGVHSVSTLCPFVCSLTMNITP